MFLKKDRITLFLMSIYEMSQGNPHTPVLTATLGKKIGMEEPEISEIGVYLKEEGLIDFYSFNNLNITHLGRKVGDRLTEELYSQKKRRVLEAIADMNRLSSVVLFPSLVERVGMSDREVSEICNQLDEEGLIEFPGGDFVRMKGAGYEELEPKKPT